VDGHIAQYDKLEQQIAAAKAPSTGGFAARMPARMLQDKENELGQLAQQIKQTLEADIDMVRANYDRYTQGLKTMSAMAKQRLESAKAAAKQSAKTKNPQDVQAAVHETAGAARDIQLLLDTVEDDSRNFGQSWFNYRQLNPHLPDNITGVFLAKRTALINDAKMTTARLQKFRELSTQVRALNKLSADLAAGARQNANDSLQEATKLAKKVTDAAGEINNGGSGLKLGWMSAQTKYAQLHADATNQGKNKKTDLKVGEDRYADSIASTKIIRAKIKSLKVVFDSGLKSFTNDEKANKAVKTKLDEAQEAYNTAAGYVKAIEKAEAQAKKDIEIMRKRCV
jgi:hypothetical protein